MKIPSRVRARKDYIQFLKNLEVVDICLTDCIAKFDKQLLTSSPKQISISGRSSFARPLISKSDFTVAATMEVIIGGSAKSEAIAKIRVTYNLTFIVRGGELDTIHIGQFSKSNIKIVIWPFFREFIHNMTARFGIPHVNVPIHSE